MNPIFLSPNWPLTSEIQSKSNNREKSKEASIHFVTTATHSSGYFDILLQSCRRFDIPLIVLGWAQKWGGWMWRLDLILNHYRSLEPTDIVCFVDAYDVVFLQGKEEILHGFLEMDSAIVVAEDYNSNPVSEMYARSPFMFGTCRGVRVNAGSYIGYVADLIKLLEEMKSTSTRFLINDDQKLLTLACRKDVQHLERSNQMAIDTKKNIFLCMRYTDLQAVGIKVEDSILSYHNSTRPCILHGAGKAKLDSTIVMLGYDLGKSGQSSPSSQSSSQSSTFSPFLCCIAIMIIFVLGYIAFFFGFFNIVKYSSKEKR